MTSFGWGVSTQGLGAPNANQEFRDMITGILHGGGGSTFPPMLKKGYETKQNGGRPIPPIPLETLKVLVWLFYFLDGGFGATVSHLMVPELEQRSMRPARSAGRKNGVRNVTF